MISSSGMLKTWWRATVSSMTPREEERCPPVRETFSRTSHRSSWASCLRVRRSMFFMSSGLLIESNMGLTRGPEYGGPVGSVTILMEVRGRRRWETFFVDRGLLRLVGMVNP